jgi:hypothetical protein
MDNRGAEERECSAKGPPPLTPIQKRMYTVSKALNLTGSLKPGFIKARRIPSKKQIMGKFNILVIM